MSNKQANAITWNEAAIAGELATFTGEMPPALPRPMVVCWQIRIREWAYEGDWR